MCVDSICGCFESMCVAHTHSVERNDSVSSYVSSSRKERTVDLHV